MTTETPERLTAAAITRGSVVISHGFKSHGEIRSALGDTDPYGHRPRPGDIDGFMTSNGRFVTRLGAVPVAVAAGQLGEGWLRGGRALLSSDINWEGVRP